jgi:hypothetical protein
MSGEDAHTEVLNQDAQGRLRTIIERVERLEQEKSEVAEQIKEVFAEAKVDAVIATNTTVARDRVQGQPHGGQARASRQGWPNNGTERFANQQNFASLSPSTTCLTVISGFMMNGCSSRASTFSGSIAPMCIAI